MVRSPDTMQSVIAAASILLISGCSSPSTAILDQPGTLLAQPVQLVTGGIQALGSVELPKVPEPDPEPVGRPTELYARVARGATRCWFGGEGHLKSTHIFNAYAEPESKGGNAEIVIHEKSRDAPDPRGNRAYRVSIVPEGDTATVSVENSRFPLDEAARMEREVRRWARGDETCSPRAAAQAPVAQTTPSASVGRSSVNAKPEPKLQQKQALTRPK